MSYITKIKERISGLLTSTKRFPLSMTAAVCAAVALIMEISKTGNVEKNYMGWALLFIFIVAITVFLKLLSEALTFNVSYEEYRTRNFKISVLAYIVSLPIIFGVYKLIVPKIPDYVYYQYFGLLFLFMTGCFYIGKISYRKDYVPYVVSIFYSFCIACVYSIILFLGVSAILFAVKNLLGVGIRETDYAKAAAIIFVPFAVGIFLSGFPSINKSLNDYEIPKVIRILFEYILLPVFVIYMVILYIYFGKILVQGAIPKNIITNLVVWYGLLATAFTFFISYIEDSTLLKKFIKFFPYFIIPILGMMFYSLGIRISQYGFTENRYLVMLLGVFILVSNIYFIIYKGLSNIAIPIMLSFFILVGTVGPLSCENIALDSQTKRLEKTLVKNEMLKDGNLMPNENISPEDREVILTSLRFLKERDKLQSVKFIPADFNFENTEKVLGFSDEYATVEEKDYVTYDSSSAQGAIDIEGYKNGIFVNMGTYNDEYVAEDFKFFIKDNALKFVKLSNPDEVLGEIDLGQLKNRIKAFQDANTKISPKDLEIKGTKGDFKYAVILKNVYYYSTGYNRGAEDVDLAFFFIYN